MSTRTLAVVSAGLSNPSSTRLLADRLTTATVTALQARGDDATVEVVELRGHARDLADNLTTGFANESLRAAVDTVVGADAVIAVPTGVFAATEDWAGGGTDAALAGRVDRAAGELADMIAGRRPATPTEAFDGPFGGTPSFEALLRGV
jgi:hypothetical protein